MSLANFYPVSIVCGCLDPKTEDAFISYLLEQEKGIYYIYDQRMADVPSVFQSREASRYLSAIELLAQYERARPKLRHVVDWLNGCRNENGCWDMGKTVNDKIHFPLSDNWRKPETREADCTIRLSRLIHTLTR